MLFEAHSTTVNLVGRQALNTLSLNCRRQLFKQYGTQASAYFNFQPNVAHYGDPNLGFISFFEQKLGFSTINIVFSNPVCAEENLKPLLKAYLNSGERKTMFFGIDSKTKDTLVELGYTANHIGPDYCLKVKDFSLQGKSKKHLRWANNLGKRGFTVKEQRWLEVDATTVKDISDKWRQEKVTKHQELRLLTRPPEFRDAWGVRKFYCYQNDELVGYVFFDPYYKDGKVIGYCANILRSYPHIKPNGLLDFTILKALEVFKEEGVEYLSLGFAPLHDIQPSSGENKLIRHIATLFYKYGKLFYSFKSLAYHKTRYRPEQTDLFVCIKDISIPKVIALTIASLNVF